MENYSIKLEFLLVVISAISTVTVANRCSYTYYTYYAYGSNYESTTTAYMYCSEGCCGSPPDYHCCSNYYYYNYYSYYNADLTAGAITGIVLGVLVSMAIMIGIIICVVVMCRNSKLKRQRAQLTPGVIFQPQQTGAGVVNFMPGTTGQMNPYGVVYQPVTGLPQQTVTGVPQQTVIQPTAALAQPTSGVVHGHPVTQNTVPMTGIQPVSAAPAPTAQVQQVTRSPVHGQMEKSNDSPPPMYNP
ncbi:hypothetical protein FSP39_020211 [Pinctada imbricata]|uniref:Cysteine and tyrosine-rich protein 1 n=1 Tax=Pinctada imbricata TaxID=66713 RepID=A0AA88YQF2_PINIB|nr:hypothetical protein FSP39_020211 [Pinctada imbricata]